MGRITLGSCILEPETLPLPRTQTRNMTAAMAPSWTAKATPIPIQMIRHEPESSGSDVLARLLAASSADMAGRIAAANAAPIHPRSRPARRTFWMSLPASFASQQTTPTGRNQPAKRRRTVDFSISCGGNAGGVIFVADGKGGQERGDREGKKFIKVQNDSEKCKSRDPAPPIRTSPVIIYF